LCLNPGILMPCIQFHIGYKQLTQCCSIVCALLSFPILLPASPPDVCLFGLLFKNILSSPFNASVR
uniref:Uncharacterized protein n=1 Tax=Callorhinchus milii TaxID=7868 RepID=A0A4W3J5E6_CALMI